MKRDYSEIEQMIDKDGIKLFLQKVAGICYEKSNHVAETWQDEPLAKAWETVGRTIEKIDLGKRMTAALKTISGL